MLNIKNTITLGTVICCLIICFAAAPQKTSAQAKFLPPGSYLKSCDAGDDKYTRFYGAELSAYCKTKSGKGSISSIPDAFLCDGDISNENGILQCRKNENNALMKSAKSAVDVSYESVTGLKIQNKQDYVKFVRLMFEDGLTQKYFQGALSMPAQDFFVNWLSKPANAELKAQVIDRAFTDVYSYGVSPKDLLYWRAQKAGYGKIAYEESLKLNKPENKALRRLMILAAYKKTMGRAPSPAEYDYWTPRPQTFKQLVEANRAFLYSTKGGDDLIKTVKSALADKLYREPTVAEINAAIVKYTKNKNIYDEM